MAFYLTFVFNLIAGHLLVSNPRLSYLKQDYWFELKVSEAEPGFLKWGGEGVTRCQTGYSPDFHVDLHTMFFTQKTYKRRGVTGTPGPLPLP